MTTEGTPNILLEVLQDVEPAPDTLATIWSKIGSDKLEFEELRIRDTFLEVAGKLITISAINAQRREDNERTIPT